MGMMKRFLEDVAEEMGYRCINDPEVLAEAYRRLESQKGEEDAKGKSSDRATKGI